MNLSIKDYFFIFLVASLCPLFGDIESQQAYLSLIAKEPSVVEYLGKAQEGEIEILLDPQKMVEIEQKTRRHIGLIGKDSYWMWINDACRFPSGKEGVYGRILSTKRLAGTTGVVVMPILPDGRIALIIQFRHPTRSWEIELPRGCLEEGESLEEAAYRETKEETGCEGISFSVLGEVPPDSGMAATLATIVSVRVTDQFDAEPEDTEAIEGVVALTPDEIKKAFLERFFECEVRGVKRRVHFRDPFLAYALLLHNQ